MRGRPVLGAIAGLFLGAFVAVDLMMFGVKTLDPFGAFGFPLIGLALGVALGLWAPLGRRRATGAREAGTSAVEEPPQAP